MQEPLVIENTVLIIILFISCLVTFLSDYLSIRYMLKGTTRNPSTASDVKPNRVTPWGCGIFPGLLVFIILGFSIMMEMMDPVHSGIIVLVFAIPIILASFLGGRQAMSDTKQKVEVDFELESENVAIDE